VHKEDCGTRRSTLRSAIAITIPSVLTLLCPIPGTLNFRAIFMHRYAPNRLDRLRRKERENIRGRMQLKKDGNTTTVVVAEQDEAAGATAATVSATSCQYIHKIIS